MSKPSTRLRARKEQRREDKLRREEELRRVARNRRITTLGIIVVGVLAFAAVVYFVAVAQGQTSANAAYPTIDSVSCDTNEHFDVHIHAHVSIYIDGKATHIPAQVGIAPDGSCLYWLHTHSSDGVIHIEAPNGFAISLK